MFSSVSGAFFAKSLTFMSSLWEWRMRIKGRNVNVSAVAQINLFGSSKDHLELMYKVKDLDFHKSIACCVILAL